MDWWNDLTDWISSDEGWRVLSGAIIPFVAIVVAGIVAALIGRGATKRVVAMQEREARNAAVAGVVSAARKAANWGSLGHDERGYADHLAEDADIRLRLLPVSGAPLAANWAQHEIADIKKNSSTFSFQADQSLAEFRDRMLEWQARPNRARKLFKSDLERWKFDSPDPDAELIARQQEWNADQTGSNRAGASDRSASDGSGVQQAPAAASSAAASSGVGSAVPGTAGGPSSSTPAGAAPAGDTPTTTSLRPALRRPSSADGRSDDGTPAAPAAGRAPAFSVSRGNRSDPNATTPFGATGATTPIGDAGATSTPGHDNDDGRTRAYGDETSPVRPSLGSPSLGSPSSPARRPGSAVDQDDDAAVDDDAALRGSTARPADAHVNRTDGRPDGDRQDRPAGTTSVPARIAGTPAEPADADETSEAPYTQPISASELRRRAADDD